MIQLYNTDFTLDLSDQNIQFSETNDWLDGKNFTQYSIPFTLQWTNDNKFFIELLNSNPKRLYNCWMTLEGKMRKAELEVLEFDGKSAELTIYYGLNKLPGETKLMKDFNFPIIQTSDIFAFVESVIDKNIEDTNVNFPQIIKDYPTDVEGFGNYPGILNYKHPTDQYDFESQILRPYPYLLYVLEHCFNELGYSVSGSFFENEHLKEALFVAHNEFHFLGGGPEITEWLLEEDLISTTEVVNGGQVAEVQYFKKSIPTNIINYSNITLYFLVPATHDTMGFDPEIIVSCGGVEMLNTSFSSYNSVSPSPGSLGYMSFLVNDLLIPQQIGHPIVVEWKTNKAWDNEDLPGKFKIDILPLTPGSSASLQPLTVVNPNHIDIKTLFPDDMTFGDFFSLINSSCRPLVSFSTSEVEINLGSEVINNIRVVNLKSYEKKYIKRKFDTKTSFEIKYANNSEENSSLFIENGEVNNNNYVVNENTDEIEIKLQSLFFEVFGDVKTAIIKTGDYSNVVFYDFQTGGINCIDKLNKIEDWYNLFLTELIRFKQNPETISFDFTEDYRLLSSLEADSFVFINNSLYLITEVDKTQLKKYVLNYEIEAIKLLT